MRRRGFKKAMMNNGGWIIGTLQGKPMHSNGHMLLMGPPPTDVVVKDCGDSADLFLPDPPVPVFPFKRETKLQDVQFLRARLGVNGTYFDILVSRGAVTWETTPWDDDPVVARDADGEVVGIVMPMNYVSLPNPRWAGAKEPQS